MKRVGFIIQGKTFLKSIFPLVVFSSRSMLNIDCSLYLYKERFGKSYDSLDMEYVSLLLNNFVGNGVRVVVVGNDSAVVKDLKKNCVENVVCQDAQHHGRIFCEDENFVVFSIGVFFDSLHFANTSRIEYSKSYSKSKISMPNFMYFPDFKFISEFKRMIPNEYIGKCQFRSFGSPLFDHSMFINVCNRKNRSVCFLSTLQELVSKETQMELEKFIRFCKKSNINFIMKVKKRTPWTFNDNEINNMVTVIDSELGFPYTSLGLILNTDLHISSYSTSVFEAQYFNKPCINLESVEKDSLTYAIKSIKYDYQFGELFNSNICKTVSKDLISNFIGLVESSACVKDNIIYPTKDNNNSIRILKDIENEAR